MGIVTVPQSPFTTSGERLLEMGYSVLPIIPGEKRPGEVRSQVWRGMQDWQRFCERRATSFDLLVWNNYPDAGVAVALGPASGWLVAVDFDYGSAEVRAALEAVIPPSPVRKKGAKGYTGFYRGSPAIAARVFRIGGQSVCEVLARGRQTVLPPTIHPDTRQAYEWITLDTLEDMAVNDLPVLPEDIVEQIATALAPFGYQARPEPAPAKPRPVDADDEDSVWQVVNKAALANLDAWVPALNLEKCRKVGARYEAVAHWRPSSSGRSLVERNPNLSADGRGIRDFGDDRGYSPLDLVAAACNCTFDDAFAWLQDRVLPRQELILLRPKVEAVPAAAAEPDPPHDPETGEVLEDLVVPPLFEGDALAPKAAGGLIGMMADEFCRNDRFPIPEFMTISAIATASVLFGRRYVGPTGLGLNLYIAGIAQTGRGKNKPLNLGTNLLRAAGLARMCGPERPRSDAAIVKVVRLRPLFLMKIDEVGLFLQNVSGARSANWERRILEILLDLYTASTNAWSGNECAGDEEDRSQQPVHCPTVSLFGMSTPEAFFDAITEKNLSDGFLNRLTLVQATTIPTRQKVPAVTVFSEDLMKAVRAAVMPPPADNRGNLVAANIVAPGMAPVLTPVPWASAEVERYWESIEDWQHATSDEDPSLQGITGRAAEQTQKLATLRALSRGQGEAVELEDVAWGWAIVSRSIEFLKAGIKNHLAGSDFERLCKAILEALRVAGPAGLARSLLLQKKGISKAKSKEFDEAIQRLVETELILPPKIGTGPKGGRPGMRFYLCDLQEA